MRSWGRTCYFCLLTVLALGVTTACSTQDRGGSRAAQGDAAPAPVSNTTSAAAGPSFDVGAVMRRVHFAFRLAGGAFEGGHSTYGVQVSGAGRVHVTPVQHLPLRGPGKDLGHRVLRGRALTLQTAGVSCGDRPLSSAAAVTVADDGSLKIDRGAVIERLQNTDAGVEQRWHFAERPCAGDLLVRVRARGLPYAGATRGGLHFADRSTGLGLRVGHATWIDANGARTSVRAVHARGEIRLRVPAAALRRSAFPAVLDPVISPELGLDKPLAGPAWASQGRPRVTHDGTNHLVVWQDYRNLGAPSWDIYGARVSAAGKLLDAAGIPISSATGHQQLPRVASGKGTSLVIWQDYRNNATYPDIYGARLTPNGALLDAAGIPVSTAIYHQSNPDVSFGGGHYFVVWRDYRDYKKTAWDVYGARVATNGNLQDAKGIPISTAAKNQGNPSVDFDGKGFLVAWHDNRTLTSTQNDIYGARVSAAGVVQDKAGLGVSYAAGNQQYPSVAYGGGRFLVVWEDERNTTSVRADVYGARVQSTGTLMDPAGLLISSAANNQLFPAVAHDGKNYLVVWQDYRAYAISANDIHGALVTPAGKLLTPAGVTVSSAAGDQLTPAVAFAGQKYLVVWQQGGDIHGAQVDRTGKLLHPSGVPLCTASGEQLSPAAAGSPAGYLVVWQDHRASTTYADIYGARVNHYGGLVTTKALAISAAPYGQQSPAVAFDGTNYLAVWQDARAASVSSWDIYGARVSQAGKVLDATGVAISAQLLNQVQPAVARGKAAYLVVWQDDRNKTTSSRDVYGARVSSTGAVLDPSGVALSGATTDETSPAVASDGDGYLVVWQDLRNGKDNPDLYGTTISAAGAPQSKLGLPLATTSGSAEVSPAVASVGKNQGYLLVYGRFANQSPLGAHRIQGRTVIPSSANGAACAAGKDCGSGFCADGICCDEACGGGDPTDCQACSVARGAAKDGACGPVKAGLLCRAASGPCDVAEACGGSALSCPADGLAKAGTLCRAKLGPCDAVETCTGSAAACPADVLAKAGTPCRPKAGACDVAEVCGGSALSCPADAHAKAGTTCRAKAGPCDVAETCTGSAAACPADTFASVTTTCRASAGVCDVAEVCTGASPLCPGDQLKLPGFVCRKAAGPCDEAETCAGKTTCPSDSLKADGTPCKGGQCKQGACVALPDAGGPDLGPDQAAPDLSLPDAGPEASPDTSPPADLGADLPVATGDKAAPPACEEGCTCETAGGQRGALWLLLALLALLRYRRSKR